MLSVEIIGDKQIIARFDTMNERIRQRLTVAVENIGQDLESYVVTSKLSGQVLNKQTGRLQQSIHHDVQQSGPAVIGRVYSANVPYAAIHEFGGQVRTRLGTGRNPPKPGGKAFVNMPERSFLRSSLSDYKNRIIEEMTKAVSEAVHA